MCASSSLTAATLASLWAIMRALADWMAPAMSLLTGMSARHTARPARKA
jgi:hypothetical protein